MTTATVVLGGIHQTTSDRASLTTLSRIPVTSRSNSDSINVKDSAPGHDKNSDSVSYEWQFRPTGQQLRHRRGFCNERNGTRDTEQNECESRQGKRECHRCSVKLNSTVCGSNRDPNPAESGCGCGTDRDPNPVETGTGRNPKPRSECQPPLSELVGSPFRRCSCAGVVQETCKNVSLVCESMQLSCPTVIRLCILLPLASSRLTLLVLRVELFPKSNFMPSPDGCASHNEWHDKAQQHRDGSKQEAVESIKRSIR